MSRSMAGINRRRLLGATVLGSAGGLFLAACGGGGKDEAPASGSSASGTRGLATTPPQAAGAPKKDPVKGGTLANVLAGDPPNLDLHANSTYLVNHSMSPVFNQLVKFDPDITKESPESIVADLAKSWEQSGDGLKYTFKLEQGVTFHDGKPFSSADVKATLERVASPPKGLVSPRQDSLGVLDKIETPDPSTVVITLKRPAPSLMPILAQGWMGIYNAQDIGGSFDFKLKTNGTGPFKLKEYIRGNRLTVEANPSYFVKGLPHLAGITTYIMPDAGARVSAFQSGQVMFSALLSPSDLKALEPVLKEKMVAQRHNGFGFNTVNFGAGPGTPWRDERVRRAISLGINRQESIDLLYEGEGQLGGYMPGGGAWALSEADTTALPGYTPYSDKTIAEAKQLLAAAGIKQGHQVTLMTRIGTSENLSLFLKDQFAKIGIDAKPQVLVDAAAYEALDNRNFDLAPWGHAIALDDPDAIFAEFYLSQSPRNYSGLGSNVVDDLFAKQSQTLNAQERGKLVTEMQKQALPLYGKVILAWSLRRWSYSNKVQNYVPHVGLYNNNRHAGTWLEK